MRAALAAAIADDSTHRYSVDPGLPELRRAIADVLGGRRGVAWDPEQQILVTAGANLAFAEVLPALIEILITAEMVPCRTPSLTGQLLAVRAAMALAGPWRR